MRIPIKTILRALLESETENKKPYIINEPVFEELCGICDELEQSSVYKKANGFDVEIDKATRDTILSLRFPSALSPAGGKNRITVL